MPLTESEYAAKVDADERHWVRVERFEQEMHDMTFGHVRDKLSMGGERDLVVALDDMMRLIAIQLTR